MAITPGGRVGDNSPTGHKSGQRGLTDYLREVVHALKREGHPEGEAIAIARAAQARWLRGKKTKPAVRAASAASLAAQHVLDHRKRDLANAIEGRIIDLAAAHGHHIAGTSFHWHHGWNPRDQYTAAKWGKKFGGDSTYHHVEPEEFNGHEGSPKFVAGASGDGKFGDTAPKMKYKGNKILGGASFKNAKGENVKVSSVSQSRTHVKDETGAKHRISSLTPASDADATKLALFKKQGNSSAVKQYSIQSSFKAPKKQTVLTPKKAHSLETKAVAPKGNYFAPSEVYDEPEFPHTKPRTSVNTSEPLTAKETQALKAYTGSGYSEINSSLRNGNPGGYHTPYLDKALNKTVPLDEPGLVLHRGMNVRAISELQSGDSFVDKGFVSTSRNPTLGLASRSTRLHITSMDPALKHMDVRSVSSIPHENEVLLGRNTKFTVQQRVQHGSHTHLYVHAEPAPATTPTDGGTK